MSGGNLDKTESISSKSKPYLSQRSAIGSVLCRLLQSNVERLRTSIDARHGEADDVVLERVRQLASNFDFSQGSGLAFGAEATDLYRKSVRWPLLQLQKKKARERRSKGPQDGLLPPATCPLCGTWQWQRPVVVSGCQKSLVKRAGGLQENEQVCHNQNIPTACARASWLRNRGCPIRRLAQTA